ncbi:MAG: acyltransferase [bacterium]
MKLNDVVVLRAIATIEVVAFHAYGFLGHKAHFPTMNDIYHNMYPYANNANSGFFSIRMPLFIFISGFLFSFLLKKEKYHDTFKFFTEKLRRLLLPYCIFCAIFMLSRGEFSVPKLLEGNYLHLWFLPMLFWCFLITYTLHKIFNRIKCCESCILSITFGLTYLDIFIPNFMGLGLINNWLYWFYLGYIIFKFKNTILEYITNYKLYLLLSVLYVGGNIFFSANDLLNLHTINILIRTSGILLIWYFINILLKYKNGKWAEYKIFSEINRCSYGIYVYHYWLQTYMISQTAKSIFHLEKLAEHVILFPILYTIASLIISYFATHITLKTRVGKYLLG